MRADALHPATAAAAGKATSKLASRLSKGEKRNRKRMAEVGAVYDASPAPRASPDILPANQDQRARAAPGPATSNKWLTASVVDDATQVVAQIFDEAERRDPDHARTWIALVDGNNHQIDRITAEAATRKIPVAITIDFIHVLEYLWKAAWCFYAEGDPVVEAWVQDKARAILAGRAAKVAGAIRRQATNAKLEPTRHTGADTCAKYLTNKAPLPGLPDRADQRLADRYRRHRRRLPAPGKGPPRHHRRPLGTARSRGHPQTSRRPQQRRPRRLLGLPPRPGTAAHPPLTLRRQRHPAGGMTSLQKCHTLIIGPSTRSRWCRRLPGRRDWFRSRGHGHPALY